MPEGGGRLWLVGRDGEEPSEWPQGASERASEGREKRKRRREREREGERSKADAAPEQDKCVWSC